MLRLLFDTGIYVDYLRAGEHEALIESMTGGGVVHLSVVVGEELLVGATTRATRRFIERFIDLYSNHRRLEVPTTGDWLLAGRTIQKIADRQGYEKVRRSRLTNDALIACTARRIGATLVTRNPSDFGPLARLLGVRVVAASQP